MPPLASLATVEAIWTLLVFGVTYHEARVETRRAPLPMKHKSRLKCAAIIAGAAVVGGCSAEKDLFGQHPANSQYEAGSTHVAVISVAPWSEIDEVLQPNFQLTSDQALEKTLATTLLGSNRLAEAFASSLQLGLPGTSETQVDSRTVDRLHPPNDEDKTTITKQLAPGTLPSLGTEPAASAAALTEVKMSPNSIGREAGLQYQTATALYQEVQLLNRYVKYALARPNFTAYLARLQLSVLPFARGEPYDIYADISFMLPRPGRENKPGLLADECSPDMKGNSLSGFPAHYARADTKDECFFQDVNASREVPTVIPLLVTDMAEQSLQSRAVQILQQLDAALGGTVNGFAIQGKVGSARDNIAQALGADINALSTVGRVNGNTIRVRLGAANTGTSKFSILPRANNITVLVLVPTREILGYEPRVVPISMHTRLRHVETGKVLPDLDSRARAERDKRIQEIVDTFDLARKIDSSEGSLKKRREIAVNILSELSGPVAAANYDQFITKITAVGWTSNRDTLWTDLASIRSGYGYATAAMWLPERPVIAWPDPSQSPLVLDDTKAQASARLRGAKVLASGQVSGRLRIGSVELVASDTKFVDDDLVLSFPSPELWNVAPRSTNKQTPARVSLDLEVGAPAYRKVLCPLYAQLEPSQVRVNASPQRACIQSYRGIYRSAKADPKLPFVVTTSADGVGIDKDGKGKFRFALRSIENSGVVQVRAEGAVIDQVSPSQYLADRLSWKISQAGTVEVQLSQLSDSQRFAISIESENGAKQTIHLEAKSVGTKADKKE